jgi:hypothetical protein
MAKRDAARIRCLLRDIGQLPIAIGQHDRGATTSRRLHEESLAIGAAMPKHADRARYPLGRVWTRQTSDQTDDAAHDRRT